MKKPTNYPAAARKTAKAIAKIATIAITVANIIDRVAFLLEDHTVADAVEIPLGQDLVAVVVRKPKDAKSEPKKGGARRGR